MKLNSLGMCILKWILAWKTKPVQYIARHVITPGLKLIKNKNPIISIHMWILSEYTKYIILMLSIIQKYFWGVWIIQAMISLAKVTLCVKLSDVLLCWLCHKLIYSNVLYFALEKSWREINYSLLIKMQ
jgi:hypothetical protein